MITRNPGTRAFRVSSAPQQAVLVQLFQKKRQAILLVVLLLTLWLPVRWVLAGTPTFLDSRDFGTGVDNTYSVAIGDVDGDGHLDMIIGNDDEQNVVYLGDGEGGFSNTASFGTGEDNTYAVALGDMDGDGDLDIVTGNDDDQNRVHLNDGAGNFETSHLFGTGDDNTRGLAIGDIDGDGDLDIITGNYDEQNTVYQNNGSGVFESSHQFGTGIDNTYDVALGDVDGDGDLDIVVGNYDEQDLVYLNDGDLDFVTDPVNCLTPPNNVRCFGEAGGNTQSVKLGDMDGDGDLDIVTGDDMVQSVVYLNNGAGAFHTGDVDCASPPGNARCFGSVGDNTHSVSVADVNGDGHLDIVAGNTNAQSAVFLNNGTGHFDDVGSRVDFGTGTDDSHCVAAADLDENGHLDIVAGNRSQQNVVYLNNGGGLYGTVADRDTRAFGAAADSTTSTALGDVDGDGDLDIITGDDTDWNVVFLNDGQGSFYTGPVNCPASNVSCFGTGLDQTWDVTVGDINGDRYLDIVVANNGWWNAIYLNDDNEPGSFDAPGGSRKFGTGGDSTWRVAVGDVDGDGDLDIAAANHGEQSVVYINDGLGGFHTGEVADCDALTENARCIGGAADDTTDLALGDVDGDGHLDIVVGVYLGQSAVYLNDGGGYYNAVLPFGGGSDATWSVALGDVEGDGDLDVVVGNYNQQNVVYLNDGKGNLDTTRNFGNGEDATVSVAVADMDGDGDLDILTGDEGGENLVYTNDGDGWFLNASSRAFGTQNDNTWDVVAGDVDGDGDLDLVTNNYDGQNMIYLNRVSGAEHLTNNPPMIALHRPGSTPDGEGFSSSAILEDRFIPISYALFDPEGDPVGRIRAYYSLDGGGRWTDATPAEGTPLTNLTTGIYPTRTSTNTYVFTWDTFTSGVFGQSDNVMFRLEAFAQSAPGGPASAYLYANRTAGSYQRPYASATSFPFRVRGTQARVLSGTLPASNAVVYRVPAGQIVGGSVIVDDEGRPMSTDSLGYLQSREAITVGDRLVAMLPITWTESYTLYHTSALPTVGGLQAITVTNSGVQTLTISAAHALVLLNLDVSLEWDAREDEPFMSQLALDLQRTSEILYDWTNGQMALGHVRVYHEREEWLAAHIRVYASNRVRPNATQGGIITQVISDPLTTTYTYAPGQVHIGAVWNRYGDPDGSSNEDWPRTLAHELGHYALYLDDNYLGLDADGLLVPVEGCPGAMSDPYRPDDSAGYDEFHHGVDWEEDCGTTLAAHYTGRWDWATITTFYPALNGVSTNTGPNSLPLAVTEIQIIEPVTPTTVLKEPRFSLTQDGIHVQPGTPARAFLFQEEHLIDLGRPLLDYVQARGARVGDRLCVYELTAGRLGCETVAFGDEQVALYNISDWQPDVILSPVTSRTVVISVTNVPTGLALGARLFPMSDPAPEGIALTPHGDYYSGTFHLEQPTFVAYAHVWVDEAEPRREIVTDYSLGGNPGLMLGRRGPLRGRYGLMLGRRAPAVSADGGAILFGPNIRFEDGEFYALQAATNIPSAPPWATVVGQAMRLSTSANAPDLNGTSLTFYYLGSEVPQGEETWLRLYHWNGVKWEQLPTRLDVKYNVASAPCAEAGLYALMSSFEVSLDEDGWNDMSYPVSVPRPPGEALQSIDGYYNTVYGFVVTDTLDPWEVYAVGVPEWVNDLAMLEPGETYKIHVSEPVVVKFRGNAATGRTTPMSHRPPPATYYGWIEGGPNFTPTVGMTITAWIDDRVCAQTKTREIEGDLVYVIDVMGDDFDDWAYCGAPGRKINFQIGSEIVAPSPVWNTYEVHRLDLRRMRLYMPILLKLP